MSAAPIRQLPDSVINQIAAGEVVERPASVIKELVENAVDAGARRIDVAVQGGGLQLIRVMDDGGGMAEAELPLAVARHCTSKLPGAIDDIQHLGFRGEALPSIGAVARLSIASRQRQAENGHAIRVDGGRVAPVQPAALNPGTIVEVRDLFFNVPARLKFLRGAQAEAGAAGDVVRRMALALPEVAFSLATDATSVSFPASSGDGALLKRVRAVMGEEFAASAVDIEAEREGVHLYGHVSPPQQNRANARMQFAYVNGRAVRDRQILAALSAAYADRLPRGRHASAVLFIEIDPTLVDVNVHPAKAEVRFRDAGNIRALIIGGIRRALDAQSLTADRQAAGRFGALVRQAAAHTAAPANVHDSPVAKAQRGVFQQAARTRNPAALWTPLEALEEPDAPTIAGGLDARGRAGVVPSVRAEIRPEEDGKLQTGHRLGMAKAQVHRNYIVAQTADSLILVDQHAAHERLVFEALKRGLDTNGAPSQMLLIPEIVTLPMGDAARLLRHGDLLARFGLHLEGFGEGAIAVTGTPAMLGEVNAKALIHDLADEISERDTADGLRRRLDDLAARIACHGSVRSGRVLRMEEMDALLRQMEATPGSGTCNHGRPTFVELSLADIERLFERR
ncbi:MAG: DNA mismatch repair endonuclease MutL [Rhizobiaceae bacterium]|nr:DNA mismatch repair endonuclease MutL [Rhizobiaceae bacterium]